MKGNQEALPKPHPILLKSSRCSWAQEGTLVVCPTSLAPTCRASLLAASMASKAPVLTSVLVSQLEGLEEVLVQQLPTLFLPRTPITLQIVFLPNQPYCS